MQCVEHLVAQRIANLRVQKPGNAPFLPSEKEQRRSSVAGLTEYPTDSVHEEWQVGDTVQLRTEPFEL